MLRIFSKLHIEGTIASLSTVSKRSNIPKNASVSGYSLFLKDMFQKYEGKATERLSKVALEWKSLSDPQKQVYNETASKLRAERSKELENCSDEELLEKKERKEEKAARAKRKEKRIKRLEEERQGRPKLPIGAFPLFMKAEFQSTEKKKLPDGRINVPDILKSLREKWNNLEPKAKESYISEANRNLEKYKADVAAWKLSQKSKDMSKE